jgi:hypothetical protein
VTDSNAWIGQSPSVINDTENAEGYERQDKTYTRTTEKQETNKQGEWFVSCMNSIDMIVINGIRSVAKCTYDHQGREAKSTVDYMVVNKQMYNLVSDVSYTDCREKLETDHWMLSVEVTHSQEMKIDEIDERKRKKKKKKTKKPIMEKLKTVTRNDPYWKTLVQECDEILREYSTIRGQSVDEDYEVFNKN